ncbi:Hypothetical protein H16_B2392 [Cupriavidus necator H16]|uniref:Uncharacterized protein n=1 Tax=Cupriavidus necator (strain ATCC 17699 / DSM 428 / KCTC 22496 / NCIMB 10442 / H16 / Stanier 337) TaxID=381666 RepID=Q0JYK0_CUPNH|nr:Hypothetical protein H16_B2392 [Cupriavidus necator H16]
MAFQIKRIVVPYESLKEMGAENQYALYLLGHIYNEIMCLNRWSVLARRDVSGGVDAEQAGAVFNIMFVTRILAGKLYEAKLIISQKIVKQFLEGYCYPHMPESDIAGLKALNRAMSQCKWINPARNGHAMHYPEFENCKEAINALNFGKQGFEIFAGGSFGATMYRTSDVMAGAAFIFEANRDWGVGLNTIVEDVLSLSHQVTEFTNSAIGAFVNSIKSGSRSYSERVKIKDVPKFPIPDMTDFVLPYFMVVRDKD